MEARWGICVWGEDSYELVLETLFFTRLFYDEGSYLTPPLLSRLFFAADGTTPVLLTHAVPAHIPPEQQQQQQEPSGRAEAEDR